MRNHAIPALVREDKFNVHLNQQLPLPKKLVQFSVVKLVIEADCEGDEGINLIKELKKLSREFINAFSGLKQEAAKVLVLISNLLNELNKSVEKLVILCILVPAFVHHTAQERSVAIVIALHHPKIWNCINISITHGIINALSHHLKLKQCAVHDSIKLPVLNLSNTPDGAGALGLPDNLKAHKNIAENVLNAMKQSRVIRRNLNLIITLLKQRTDFTLQNNAAAL